MNLRRRLLAVDDAPDVPIGTEFVFDYTGNIQEVTLPKGMYYLECAGALGGDQQFGEYTRDGGLGSDISGYTILNRTTKLYVYVGGKNGWNGGGETVVNIYEDTTTPMLLLTNGGGATDIRLDSSLSSRIIVGGGGPGYNKGSLLTTYNISFVKRLYLNLIINTYQGFDGNFLFISVGYKDNNGNYHLGTSNSSNNHYIFDLFGYDAKITLYGNNMEYYITTLSDWTSRDISDISYFTRHSISGTTTLDFTSYDDGGGGCVILGINVGTGKSTDDDTNTLCPRAVEIKAMSSTPVSLNLSFTDNSDIDNYEHSYEYGYEYDMSDGTNLEIGYYLLKSNYQIVRILEVSKVPGYSISLRIICPITELFYFEDEGVYIYKFLCLGGLTIYSNTHHYLHIITYSSDNYWHFSENYNIEICEIGKARYDLYGINGLFNDYTTTESSNSTLGIGSTGFGGGGGGYYGGISRSSGTSFVNTPGITDYSSSNLSIFGENKAVGVWEGNGKAIIKRVSEIAFSYTGSALEINLNPGTYKLQCWGAQGGSYYSYSSAGGYAEGVLTLTSTTKLYIYVGGQGRYTTGTGLKKGGFNGGGDTYVRNSTYQCGSGGGASDIRIGQDSLYARVIVAGGGGGSGKYSSSSNQSGGEGGGTSGKSGFQYSTSYKAGTGGTLSAKGDSYYQTTANSTTYGYLAAFGTGGYRKNTSYDISGGGGGWYGGGYGSRSGAGGGSGYVYTSSTKSYYPSGCKLTSSHYLTNASTTAGSSSFPNIAGTDNETGHLGNGYVKITQL